MKLILFVISISLLLFDQFCTSQNYDYDYNEFTRRPPTRKETDTIEEVEETTTTPKPTTTTSNTTTSSTPTTKTTLHPRFETQSPTTQRSQTQGKSLNANQTKNHNGTESSYSDSSEEGTTKATTKRREQRESDSDDKYKDRSNEAWYIEFRNRHNLPEPIQLPGRKKVVDLEKMPYCKCPRVYWPVCAKNNITYLNYCVMECLDQQFRRHGPCIYYRKSGVNFSGFLSDK